MKNINFNCRYINILTLMNRTMYFNFLIGFLFGIGRVINLLLDFLVYTTLYMKRSRQDVANEDNPDETNEEIEDMTDIRSKIKDLTDKGVVDRVERGLPVPTKDFRVLDNIKKEFDSYFDKDSGNTLKKGLEEVDEYLEGEISTLSKNNPSEASNTSLEDESKRRKVDDSTNNCSSSTDLPFEMPSIFDDVD